MCIRDSFKVTVTDKTAPVLTVPAVTYAVATGPNGARVTIDATATDLVDGTVAVVCSPASGSQFPMGSTTVTCTATDSHGNATTKTVSVIVYAPATADGGSFVISDKQAVLGSTVTYWGSQWEKANPFSSGVNANSSFKGYIEAAASKTAPKCGGAWTSSPGNSSNPPSTVPAYMAVVVATKVTKSGSTIGGDVKKIVVVKTAAGYDANPGHPGTGTVVATLCG